MPVKIFESILPISNARSGQRLSANRGVTMHETGNFSKGANAAAHNTYLHKNGGKDQYVSYHYATDDAVAYLFIPLGEKSWHAGDGASGPGNSATVSIEICENPECNFPVAVDNACYIAALELKRMGFADVVDGMRDKANGNLFQHYSWSGKNCPQQIRAGLVPWDLVVNTTQQYLDDLCGKKKDAFYRVQIGAFSVKSNAEAFLANVREMGLQAFLVPLQNDGKFYRVQVGAFSSKENAEAYMKKVKAMGLQAFVVEPK